MMLSVDAASQQAGHSKQMSSLRLIIHNGWLMISYNEEMLNYSTWKIKRGMFLFSFLMRAAAFRAF
jgi:hypothetical protein